MGPGEGGTPRTVRFVGHLPHVGVAVPGGDRVLECRGQCELGGRRGIRRKVLLGRLRRMGGGDLAWLGHPVELKKLCPLENHSCGKKRTWSGCRDTTERMVCMCILERAYFHMSKHIYNFKFEIHLSVNSQLTTATKTAKETLGLCSPYKLMEVDGISMGSRGWTTFRWRLDCAPPPGGVPSA